MNQIIQFWVGEEFQNAFNDNFIKINDHYFVKVRQNKEFLKSKEDYIYSIDQATIVDYNLFTVSTPFGTTSIDNLSTGLKTLLNTLYLIESASLEEFLVNLDECGDQVINTILKVAGAKNVSFSISRTVLIDSEIFNKFSVKINTQDIKDSTEFLLYMSEVTENILRDRIRRMHHDI